MDLFLVFTLTLCCWAAEAVPFLPDTPELLISSDEIKEGESVGMTCVLPIDYGGGECRLYRGNNNFPLKVARESNWQCVFNLTWVEVLGKEPVGRRVLFTCDYNLPQYTSSRSIIGAVAVIGVRPSPTLSVSKRVVTLSEKVEVNCTPPNETVHTCHFYSNDDYVAHGACSLNVSGKDLATWENSTLLHPASLTCKYYSHAHLNVRSEHSDPQLVLVIDPAQASSSMDCNVQVEKDQLEKFGDTSWRFESEDKHAIRVQVSNITPTSNKTVDCVKKLD